MVSGIDVLVELKVVDLLAVWARVIADWHGWEEVKDLPIFDCIKEIVNVQKTFALKLFVKNLPSPPAPPVPGQSVVESIGAFVCEAIPQYSPATWRACACIDILLHLLSYPLEVEDVKQSLVVAFSQASMSRFREIQSKPCPLWKPLLLAISSCYLCYPEMVEMVLEKAEKGGFVIWASALNSYLLLFIHIQRNRV